MIRICILLGLLLHVSRAAQEDRAVIHFCPECWRFASEDGEWSRDEAGCCWTCGKPPVEMEAAFQRWWWCSRRSAWLRAPCADARRELCCTLQAGWAAAAAPGERLNRARFCPECRTFETMDSLPLRCRECGRPPVKAEAVTRGWVWCRTARAWRDTRCPADPAEECCVEKSGRILAR